MDMKDYLTIVSEFNVPIDDSLFVDLNRSQETEIVKVRNSLIESVMIEDGELTASWDDMLTENDAQDLSMLVEEVDSVSFYNLNGLLFFHKEQALAAIKSLSKYP